MISLHDRAPHCANFIHTLLRVSIVAHYIAQADHTTALLALKIRHDGIKRVQIRVNVTDDCRFRHR